MLPDEWAHWEVRKGPSVVAAPFERPASSPLDFRAQQPDFLKDTPAALRRQHRGQRRSLTQLFRSLRMSQRSAPNSALKNDRPLVPEKLSAGTPLGTPAMQGIQGPLNQLRLLLHQAYRFLMKNETLEVLQLVCGCDARGTSRLAPGPRQGCARSWPFVVGYQQGQVLRYPEHSHHTQVASKTRRWLAGFHHAQRHARKAGPFRHLDGGQDLLEPRASEPGPQLEEQLLVDCRRGFYRRWHM